MRSAREHPRLAVAIASLVVLLLVVGVAVGSALAGPRGHARPGGSSPQATNAELATTRLQLESAQTQNAQLSRELAALQARLASAQRAAPHTPPASPGKTS